MAATLSCGDDSDLSHRGAGACGGSRPTTGLGSTSRPDPAPLTRPDQASTSHVSIRRIGPSRKGSRSRSPARTLLDLAAIVGERRTERALERAEKLELFDLTAIESVCRRSHGHHGLKNLNLALGLYLPDDRTRSDLERDLIDLCRDHDLPLPLINALVAGHEVDALWPEARLIVELDSWEHHRDRAAFERGSNPRRRALAHRLPGDPGHVAQAP